jgi:hypothetical protein
VLEDKDVLIMDKKCRMVRNEEENERADISDILQEIQPFMKDMYTSSIGK